MKKIKLEINNLTSDRVDKKFLNKLAEKIVKSLKIKIPEISLVFVSAGRMKNLNRNYRGINQVTDVLSFDYGEIFICLAQAKKQARQMKHSLKKELATLLIHGILHLAGYDDKTKKDYRKLLNKQNKLWQKVTSSLV